MLGHRSLVSLYLKTYSQLIACIGQKLILFLSSSHEWPMQEVVIKRELILLKDVFLTDYYLKWGTQRCADRVWRCERIFWVWTSWSWSWKIENMFELQNIWLLRKVGYLQPVVKTENCKQKNTVIGFCLLCFSTHYNGKGIVLALAFWNCFSNTANTLWFRIYEYCIAINTPQTDSAVVLAIAQSRN